MARVAQSSLVPVVTHDLHAPGMTFISANRRAQQVDGAEFARIVFRADAARRPQPLTGVETAKANKINYADYRSARYLAP